MIREKIILRNFICICTISLGLAIGYSASAGDNAYEEAMNLYKSGNYAQAQEKFQLFATHYPEHPQRKAAQFFAIKCYYILGQYSQMEQKIQELSQGEPQHPSLDDLAFLRGMAQMKLKNWVTARIIFKNFPSQYPKSPYSQKIGKRVNEETFHPLMVLFDMEMYAEFLKQSEELRAENPANVHTDDLMFLEILALRKLTRWAEARQRANELVAQHPDSPYTAKMGGKDGRTEDQAAFDFAQAVKAYHSHQFAEAYQLFGQFLLNYPNNWRVEQAENFLCHSLYHSGNPDKFLEEVSKITLNNLKHQGIERLLAIHSAALIKQGKGTEARSILDRAEASFPNSRRFPEYRQLRLESYLDGTSTLASLLKNEKEKTAIINLLNACLTHSRENKKEGLYQKNLRIAKQIYILTGEVDNFIKLLDKEIALYRSEGDFDHCGWLIVMKNMVLAESKENPNSH